MVPFQKSTPKQIGHEYISGDEESIISTMIEELKAEVLRVYQNKEMLRQIHTKMHGCVRATFTVEANIPEDLKVGVFKEARSYPAWIRLSNASSTPKPDSKKDVRGFAIKLMDVSGEKLINDEKMADTQDFLLMSSPTFFARSLAEFRGLMKAVATGNKLGVLRYFMAHPGVFFRYLKSNVACKHPLALSYHSTQPCQYGDETKAVKYLVRPAAHNYLVYGDLKNVNYLRENLAKTLATNSADFDFCIQLQTDAVKMPIEDPTVAWTSPFIKIAQIHIPAQDFDRPAQNDFGEMLSFNPWHCLPAHRPLGSFNRARKRVYEELARLRHEKNNVEFFEPTPATLNITEEKQQA